MESYSLSMQLFVNFRVQASTFQMAILLQYNHGDSFSVQQLQENTQIDTVRGIW